MRFRSRIMVLVALTLLALGVVTGVALVLGRRSQHQLTDVETKYLPLLELGYDLGNDFRTLRKTLEEAAAAAEEAGLTDADRQVDDLSRRLSSSRATIAANGGDAEALLRELREYYALARAVSAELMASDSPSEELVARSQRMSAAQRDFAAHLAAATTPDRARVRAAFEVARRSQRTALLIDFVVALGAVLVMLLLAWWIVRGAVRSLRAVGDGVERFARGDFGQPIRVAGSDEFADLAREANRTAEMLREYRERSEREDWIKTGAAGLVTECAGDMDPPTLARRALAYLARYLDAPVGAAYRADEGGRLALLACHGATGAPASFAPGQGLLGEAAQEDAVRVVKHLPGQLRVTTGLVDAEVRHLLIIPLWQDQRSLGALELGFLHEVTAQAVELATRVRQTLGVRFRTAEARQRVQALLEETQAQQEELRQTNEELEQQTLELERQRKDVEKKNRALEEAQRQVEDKAAELARTSQYKSEFLANMSHELRTPLNSVMILSKLLGDNEGGRLDDKQVEFANVINASGQELLTLINDVLDLSKVEAGKQEVVLESVELGAVAAYIRRMFEPLAQHKGLVLAVEVAPGTPTELRTDRHALEQIMRNLLSNAVKFTERGHVTVRMSGAGALVALAVSDSGVGIAPDKQERIFEAFTQAEGGTSRKYGGTGLGLAIARKLAALLGGDLTVRSVPGQNSTFTLTLPSGDGARATGQHARARVTPTKVPRVVRPTEAVADDRDKLAPGDPCMLVIDDQPEFCAMVLQMIRECGFRGLVAPDGQSGLELAERHHPSGIILDIGLPDLDGWSVMERLKANRATREIPVHLITAADAAARARQLGVTGFLLKPVDGEQIRGAIRALEAGAGMALRKVLIVEHDSGLRDSLGKLLGNQDTQVSMTGSADGALEALAHGGYECVVLGLGLPDRAGGLELYRRIRAGARTAAIPVVAHTGDNLSSEELRRVEGDPLTILIMEGERFAERVLEETRLFLHRVRSGLSALRQRMTDVVHAEDPDLRGKKVLIVDDDMRNVYSLSSALRAKELKVAAAADGLEAISQLDANPDTDAVLMDMMMPGLDGYEAIRRIRARPGRDKLPIIALTAKTMAGDRNRCIEAGASDYIPKPVDVDKLLSMLRVWLTHP